jgi:hypothetical protein
MLAVVLLRRRAIDGAKFGCNDREIASLEATKDFPDETSFDGVGLTDDKRAIHARNARPLPLDEAIRHLQAVTLSDE